MGGVSAIQKFELFDRRAKEDQQIMKYLQENKDRLPEGLNMGQAFMMIRNFEDFKASQKAAAPAAQAPDQPQAPPPEAEQPAAPATDPADRFEPGVRYQMPGLIPNPFHSSADKK